MMKKVVLVAERGRAYSRELCEGVAAYAQERNDWQIRLMYDRDLQGARKISRVDGFIMRIINDNDAKIVKSYRKPVVDVFCNIRDFGFARVDANHESIARMAAEHFLSHKFSHFAYCGYNGVEFSDRRRDAFRKAIEEAHFKCDVYESPSTILSRYKNGLMGNERIGFDDDAESISKWLDSLPKPIAIFCNNDIRANLLVHVCNGKKLRIPEDVAVLGVDNDPLICGFANPPISSVDPNAYRVGYESARLLDELLESGARGEGKCRFVEPRDIQVRRSSETYPIDPAWLSSALVFIRQNISKGLSAIDVFSYLKLSHTIVEAAFRNVLSTTVQKEIIKARMEEAKHLLSTSALTITEVAKLSGFSSPEYFCRSFTSANGEPPLAWREKNSNGRRR